MKNEAHARIKDRNAKFWGEEKKDEK